MLFFDTETECFGPGNMAPRLVCLTYCDGPGRAKLLDHKEAVVWMRLALQSDEIIVGQNVAYDMAVMAAADPSLLPLIFQAYANNRITDTMLRQQLIDIAEGTFGGYVTSDGKWHPRQYSLAALAHRHLGVTLEKDEWRTGYGQFRDVPIEQWPEGAREYPRKDAETTRDVFLKQVHIYDPPDQYMQAAAYFALHLSSVWGVHTSAARVEALAQKTKAQLEEITQDLMQAGLVRANGTRDTKAAKARMLQVMGEKHRRTATGGVCLDEDSCLASEDPLLEAYAAYTTFHKVLDADVAMLMKGTHTPIHTRYGLAATGRTTSSNPNIQNLRRAPGVREAITPRPGYVFAQADYSSFELFCLAQSCIDLTGSSALGAALNQGLDPHCVVAATILGEPYECVKKHKKEPKYDAARQTAKVANFGFPGGLGAKKLVLFAKKSYNVSISEEEAKALKAQWYESWPEMRDFFAYVDSLSTQDGCTVMCPRSKRVRGRASYCAAANTLFQGVAADAAKRALFLVSRECYTVKSSPLYGSRIIVFVHDEIILESPEAKAPEAAERLSQLMVQAAREYLPDMTGLQAEPCLMRYWSKEASTLRDENGRLMVWPQET